MLASGLAVALTVGLAPAALPAAAQPAKHVTAVQDDDGSPAPATMTADEASAEAKRSGKSVEVASLRNESSEVYATPDGNLEAREYLRPVRARVDGEWKPVDTQLAKAADGTLAPKVSTIGLEFSPGGDGPLVRMTKAGRELALSWPGPLPSPQLEGATATYRDVLPDVDLRMEAQEDGFAQLLVVKSAEAAANEELAQVRMKLAADGLSLREDAQGGLEAVDHGAGTPVFEAPRPMMWDSSTGTGESRTPTPAGLRANAAVADEAGEPAAGESAKLAPVDVALPEGGKELVLTPDAEVLKGEDTTYPVFIDPQWYSPKASAWTMASKYWASSPQYKFNGESDSGMGYCNWSYCQPNDTKRVFYRIPTSKFAGKSILSAEFVVRNTWSASCSARSVELWRTKDISSSTTWNSQNASGFWIDHLKTESFAYGYSGCSAKDAEFDVKSAVQQAANGKWATMTFGLQASSESDAYGWKRFSDKAFLRVKYNRPPSQIKMSQLTMEYGGTCKKPAAAPRVRTLGKIYANSVTDPDGDNIAVQFMADWDSGDGKGSIARWKPALTTYKKSGSSFSISLPTSIPANKSIHWYTRSYDGAQYSPWSYAGDDPTSCYFVYDTKVPAAPAISSGEYPASNPENPDDPWFDGVGKHGTFQLKAADSDVTKYWFGINGDPTSKNTLTTSAGEAKTIQFAPTKPGLNFVTAQAFDLSGNGSEVRTYQFRVKAGQPERAAWQMDEEAGAAEVQGTAGARAAALRGGATTGAEGKRGTALHLDGTTGYAVTDIPTVNTSIGFSVSAWVKLDKMPTDAAVVVAQPGNYSPGFELYYSLGYDRWVFNQYTSDTAGASIARAMAPQAGGVSANEWTHLVGVYSGGAKELQLYVNGTLAGSTPYTTAWDARRGLQIGAANLSGVVTNFFPGAIDELRLFDKPVSATEVGRLYGETSIGNGRTARAVFPMDEPEGATEVTGYADTQPLKLEGGARSGATGVAGRALALNGTDAYAHTAAPHSDTQRPFTVSAWAKLDRTPDQAATVVAQLGVNRPGFELYYSKTYNRWGFTQYSADVVGATQVRAVQPEGTTARVGEWAHLVGVHDPVTQTLTLYVNGLKAGSVAQTNPWYAGGRVQVGALSIDGGKLIQYFPGQIDDVRLYDRPVSADEVRQLFQQRPLVTARWKLDSADANSASADDSGQATPMSLQGGAKIGAGFMDGALELDGTAGYASTSKIPVDTSTSFTVTAWAQAAAVPDGEVALASAEGSKQSAFAVRFVPDATDPENAPGRWQLTVSESDAAGSTVSQADNGEFYDAREWNHLALVYDGFTKQARLYVNGGLAEVACADTDGDGASDTAACEELVPWAENVLAFKATSLQIGRSGSGTGAGSYFPGLVDDVWVFQGALSDEQVEKLAVSWFDVPTQVPGD
ncbi:LamG-like jellyroll fold domain-containing protein [[Kitasatospora] papulosa]|uniref:LamG-like jellyroll fold domain-containing protein n=1 Tax=[Kitasatospora] papulosa TaxID=1464011 RepID=UPI0037F72D70